MNIPRNMLIEAHFKKLRMPQAAKVYGSMAREAEDNNLSYEDYLLGILEQEITQRENNRIPAWDKAGNLSNHQNTGQL